MKLLLLLAVCLAAGPAAADPTTSKDAGVSGTTRGKDYTDVSAGGFQQVDVAPADTTVDLQDDYKRNQELIDKTNVKLCGMGDANACNTLNAEAAHEKRHGEHNDKGDLDPVTGKVLGPGSENALRQDRGLQPSPAEASHVDQTDNVPVGHELDGRTGSVDRPYAQPGDFLPPPAPTADHPVITPEDNSAFQAASTQRLESRADEAAAHGDDARASLLQAYASQPQAAERLANKALSRNPADKQALTALMYARQQQGRADEARAFAARVLAEDPDNALAKIVAGHAESLSRGEALSKKLSKLDLGKTAETAGAGRGGLFGPAGARPETAGAAGGPQAEAKGGSVPQAGAQAPRPPAAIYDGAQPLTPAQQLVIKAVRKHEIGDEQGAMLALAEAIDRDPKDAGAFVVRAEVDNSLLKYAQAVEDATRGADLSLSKPMLTARALRARAYANLELKQWVQALADASHAVDLDPQSGLGYLYRAMAEDKLGRGQAAADDLAQAVKLEPTLAPLAKPLMAKYGLQAPGGAPARRPWPLYGACGAVAAALLAFGCRKLFSSTARLTTTAAQRLRESTPVS